MSSEPTAPTIHEVGDRIRDELARTDQQARRIRAAAEKQATLEELKGRAEAERAARDRIERLETLRAALTEQCGHAERQLREYAGRVTARAEALRWQATRTPTSRPPEGER